MTRKRLSKTLFLRFLREHLACKEGVRFAARRATPREAYLDATREGSGERTIVRWGYAHWLVDVALRICVLCVDCDGTGPDIREKYPWERVKAGILARVAENPKRYGRRS